MHAYHARAPPARPMHDEYPISDLGTAAYLLTIGNTLSRLDRTNPRRVLFIFERAQGIEEKVEQYWNGTARVAPLALQTSQKTLKARLYADHS